MFWVNIVCARKRETFCASVNAWLRQTMRGRDCVCLDTWWIKCAWKRTRERERERVLIHLPFCFCKCSYDRTICLPLAQNRLQQKVYIMHHLKQGRAVNTHFFKIAFSLTSILDNLSFNNFKQHRFSLGSLVLAMLETGAKWCKTFPSYSCCFCVMKCTYCNGHRAATTM